MGVYINEHERSTLRGLRYMLRCLYYDGIRPYMDLETRLVGLKRKISWQSLREELYVEPQRGVKPEALSKAQVIRAAKQLEKEGLIKIVSDTDEWVLIFECVLAEQGKSAQNKAVIFCTEKPSRKPSQGEELENPDFTGFNEDSKTKAITEADTGNFGKPTHLKDKDIKYPVPPVACVGACATSGQKNCESASMTVARHDESASIAVAKLDETSATVAKPDDIATVPRLQQLLIEHGFNLNAALNAGSIYALKAWAEACVPMNVVRDAIAFANAKVGGKPATPKYYDSFVKQFHHEFLEAKKPPTTSATSRSRGNYASNKHSNSHHQKRTYQAINNTPAWLEGDT